MVDIKKYNYQEIKQRNYNRSFAPAGTELAYPHVLDCGHVHLWTASQIDSTTKQGENVIMW